MSLLTWFSGQGDTWDTSKPQILIARENQKGGISEDRVGKISHEYMCPMYPPKLVPIDEPWSEGRRYRSAGAAEIGSRLDLYVQDDTGPFIRLAGVLLLFELTSASQKQGTGDGGAPGGDAMQPRPSPC
jgi:hypothetical protein